MSHVSVALDGPSGAGKSTLARMAAKHFGFVYVDTGALYRCIGLFMLRNGVGTEDAPAVESKLKDIHVELSYDSDGVQRMILNGEDVSEAIREPRVSMAASAVSAIPQVRAFLLETQRDMARRYDVVMDGRDIGTVVLPEAQVKIFLTASATERARRRYRELVDKGMDVSFEATLRDIEARDKNDSTRDIAPLRPAEDSVVIDTTEYGLEDSFEFICKAVERKLQGNRDSE